MAKTTYTTLAELQSWLLRQTLPVFWAVATATGQPPHNAWTEFDDCAKVPRGRKLLVRPLGKDGTGGVHVHLQETALTERQPDPLVVEERRAMAIEREAFLREREEFLTYRREELDAIQEMRRKAEDVVLKIADRFKGWEESIDRRAAISADRDRALMDAVARGDTAETHKAYAATAAYALDRLVNMAALAKVKGMEDMPPEMVARFQKFLAWEAQCAFLEHLPDAERKWARDFFRLPPAGQQAVLAAVTERLREQAEARNQARQG